MVPDSVAVIRRQEKQWGVSIDVGANDRSETLSERAVLCLGFEESLEAMF